MTNPMQPILEWLITGVADIVKEVLSAITEMFTSSLSYDTSLFYQVFGGSTGKNSGFAFFSQMYDNVIMPAAISILFVSMVWTMYKSMYGKDIVDAEEPQTILIRSALGFVLMLLCQKIMVYPITMFSKLFDVVGVSLDTVSFVGANVTAGFTTPWGTVAIALIELIAVILIGIAYLELIFTYIQRYVSYAIYTFLAPLAFAGMGSKSGMDITKRCINLFVSNLITLLLSAIWCTIFTVGFAFVIPTHGGTDNIGIFATECVILYQFAKFGTKLEELLSKVGLIAVTPSRMMEPIMAMSMMGRMAGEPMRMGRTLSGFHHKGEETPRPNNPNSNAARDARMATQAAAGQSNTTVNDSDKIHSEANSTQNINNAAQALKEPKTSTNPELNTKNAEALFGKKQSLDKDGKPVNSNVKQGTLIGKPDKNGKVNPAGVYKNSATGMWGLGKKGALDPKKFADGAMALSNAAKNMALNNLNTAKDTMNDMLKNAGVDKLTGLTSNSDGSHNAFELTPNGKGDFNVKSGDQSYGSLEEAVKATGAQELSVGTAVELDSSSIGSMSEGLNQMSGITDTGGIPGASDYRVHDMGNDNMSGAYADTSGNVVGFKASVIDSGLAQQEISAGKTDIVKLSNNSYVRMTRDASLSEKMNKQYKVENGRLVNRKQVSMGRDGKVA